MLRDNEHGTSEPTAEKEEMIINEWNELLFNVRRSIRYHSKRAGWFEFCSKCATAFAIFFSTGSVVAITKICAELSIATSVSVALVSTISLVFGWSQREHLHADLKRKFAELEKAMVKCLNPGEKILAEMTAERLSIEEYEPKKVDVLDVICHNELCIAQGYGDIWKVSWLYSKICHLDPPYKNPKIERTIGMALA